MGKMTDGKRRRFGNRVRYGLTGLMVGAGVIVGGISLGLGLGHPAPATAASPPPVPTSADAMLAAPALPVSPAFLAERDGVLTLAPMLDRVTPAVVNIAVRQHVAVRTNPLLNDPFFRQFFGLQPGMQPRQRTVMSAGSGVIVDADQGIVLTNNHVVANADQITITTKDGRALQAELVGTDPQTDIAVLKVEADNLTALHLADSDTVQVGDVTIAIGNPFGLGQTVTTGVVSAKGRGGIIPDGYEDFIQTDASINPGNSGGALVNSRGDLIGINTAILSGNRGGGNVGIGFAVPSNIARTVMDQLLDNGSVQRGRLGVAIQSITPAIADSLGMDRVSGVLVARVDPNSSAASAGLQEGDVIMAVDGEASTTADVLRRQIALSRVGSTVRLTVLREGRVVELQARISA